MNSFAAIAARLATLTEPEDQVLLLSSYLGALEPDEREVAARLLADPPRARRLRLAALRSLAVEQVGDELFTLSEGFVGDAAETIALLWQTKPGANRPPAPSDIMQGLADAGPTMLLPAMRSWLDACEADARHILVRLVTGSFKPPANRHVLRQAFDSSGVRFVLKAVADAPKASQADLFRTRAPATAGTITAVLLYVHRGTSRTAPLTCTFGLWKNGALLPVGKALASDSMEAVRRHAAAHTLKRFGPTTEVEHSDKAALLLDVAFEGVTTSRRHKAGLALAAPRILGARPDHDLDAVSALEDLMKLLPGD